MYSVIITSFFIPRHRPCSIRAAACAFAASPSSMFAISRFILRSGVLPVRGENSLRSALFLPPLPPGGDADNDVVDARAGGDSSSGAVPVAAIGAELAPRCSSGGGGTATRRRAAAKPPPAGLALRRHRHADHRRLGGRRTRRSRSRSRSGRGRRGVDRRQFWLRCEARRRRRAGSRRHRRRALRSRRLRQRHGGQRHDGPRQSRPARRHGQRRRALDGERHRRGRWR